MQKISTVLEELQEDVIKKEQSENRYDANTLKLTCNIEAKSYIQQNETFLETTRDKLTSYLSVSNHQHPFSCEQLPLKELTSTVDIAIFFQRKSHIISNLCYGLLGGISLMQLVLTNTLVKGSKHELVSFIELYSKFGYVPSASFSILTTICLVFAFDRIDLVTIKHIIKEEDHIFLCNWILLFLYSVTFILSILCFKFDEVIAQYPENETILSTPGDLWIWKNLNLWRCVFGIIGWFFVCITRPYDLLEHHLCSLKKETNDTNQNSSN